MISLAVTNHERIHPEGRVPLILGPLSMYINGGPH
jgi:hypothetical protein